MKILTKTSISSVHRMGWNDAKLISTKRWKIFGITVFRLTYDYYGKWINPLV
jgi:hypothetical protein